MEIKTEIHPGAIQSLLEAHHGNPFELLGAHPVGTDQLSIRALRPTARTLAVVHKNTQQKMPMRRLREEGFFEITVDSRDFPYHYEAITHQGETEIFDDPYLFPSVVGEQDVHYFNEGRHLEAYNLLGAHLCEINGVRGTNFVVWSPNAYRVSVIGDFNAWDKRVHPMRAHGLSGLWELFIPGVGAGAAYKYQIASRVGGYQTEKSDPYGFAAELRPRTASVVADLEQYQWGDATWETKRQQQDVLHQPMAIYEVYLGSWMRGAGNRWLTYRELADKLISYVKEMGFTHIELMPIAEHPFDGSWGYQVTGYFAPTSRYGSPQDFMYLVDQCHQQGIGVILDWVPAHFPKDGHALSYFDGTHLYEHADERKGEHPDWGTYIFNYGRNEVRSFLLSNALFWIKKYHIDALRVDAVSSMIYLDFSRKAGQWIPNQYGGNENIEAIEFLRDFNRVVHQVGGITIAEESTAWSKVSRPTEIGGLGFTLKWNMGWMHDTLKYMQTDPVHRRHHHHQLTFASMYAFSENFILSLSHDEVVHMKGSMIGKMPGDWWQAFATLRLLWGYQYTFLGKKLNFMGAEFGQWREWSEERSLDWHLLDMPTHKGLQQWVRDLNRFYQQQPALWQHDFEPQGFQWIEANDLDQSVYSYLRSGNNPDDFLVVVINATPVPRYDYRIGVPKAGRYEEVLNSDASIYGGSNLGNMGGAETEQVWMHHQGQSLRLILPPLAVVVLKWSGT